MGYIYASMCMIIGILLFVKTRKINPLFIIVSFYFEFMGIWWLLNELTSIDMFKGIYILVFRIISAVVLAISAMLYIREKRKII